MARTETHTAAVLAGELAALAALAASS